MTNTATEAPAADDVNEAGQTPAADTPAEKAADQAQESSQEDAIAPTDEAANEGTTPADEAGGTAPEGTADEAASEDDDEGEDEEFPPAARKALTKVRREARSLRERLHAAESRAMRAEVAAELGIAPELASRLTGDSVEAMKADAESLLTALGIRPANTPPGMPRESTPTPSPGDDRPASLDDLAARIYAR